MKTSAVVLLSALLFGSVANATLQPLPGGANSPYIGTSIPITAGWWIGGDANNVGGGGAFEGTVTQKGGRTVSTAFWCVDDQTYFSPPAAALANITLLSRLGSSTPPDGLLGQTEYGSTAGTFTLDSTGATIANNPQTRLLMAAYLITQYGGYTTSSFSQLPVDHTKSPTPIGTNTDIQDAIWTLTNNTTFNSGNGHSGPGYQDATPTNVAYWIDQARLNYSSIDQNHWALVTWTVDGDGHVLSPQQNFIVALNPEPGFYGVLALALSGLVLAINRKRKSA